MAKITDGVKGHRINYYLAHPVLAGQKNKNQYDIQEELLFKASLFTSANFICARCNSLLNNYKIQGVNKVRNTLPSVRG